MISALKKAIKNNVFLLNIYESLIAKDVINLYQSNFSRRMLFSYSTYHFKNKNYSAHSNYQESWIIAEIFHALGYQIDIVNNNRLTKLDLSCYEVIFGEGLPMFQALSSNISAKKIYYGTGSHPAHCTEQSFSRLANFFKQTKFLANKSVRTCDYRWGLAATMSDVVICIGNQHTALTFSERGCDKVLPIDPSFHLREDAIELGLAKNFAECRKSMLWFGSYGLLHKGLDLAVDAIRNRPDWTLHVCGYTPAEKEFLDGLALPANVIVHGFVNVYSENFRNIANSCGFVILPSCSEGTATAIVTAVGNGAMIPLVTKECGFDIGQSGYLVGLASSSIEHRLDSLDLLDLTTLRAQAIEAQQEVVKRYTLDNYRTKMKQYLTEIIVTEAN